MTGVYDSIFVRTMVFQSGERKAALVTTDLLINHPELSILLDSILETYEWDFQEVFLTATHTHSSIGSWAPGLVGNLFAGDYNPEVVKWLAEKIINSLIMAEGNLSTAAIGYGALSVPNLVENRLVGEKGKIDPWLKVLIWEAAEESGVHSFYSAHATCLDHNWTKVSGDYPARLLSKVNANYKGFSAGPVGSMRPAVADDKQLDFADRIADGLREQISLLQMLGPKLDHETDLLVFKIPLELRPPNLKISGNLTLRPWLVRKVMGEYPSDISVLSIGNILMIGLPGDFSGELALPLYQYAQRKGLNLILTSFNGGYIGYIPDDRWYDLNAYETRTMSWHGHDNGAFFSEVIRKTIDIVSNDRN